MKDKIEKLTQDLVKIDTSQGNTIHAAETIKSFLDGFGLASHIDVYNGENANLIAKIGPENAPSIIISGHLDVVPVGDFKSWTYEPFSGIIKNNKLWGRGSVDMKGGTACLSGVMAELCKHEDNLTHQIIFAATAEEEVGLHGARHLQKQGIMKNATHLLIAEPSNLEVAIMEKGIIWAEIYAKGKQAHGSRPDLGINAIEGLTRLIPDLYKILPDKEYQELGKSTLNIGFIKGGTAPNVVPEEAMMIVDYRLIPGITTNEIKQKIEKLLFETFKNSILYKLEISNEADPVTTTDRSFGELLASNTEKYTRKRPELGGVHYATDGAAFMKEKQVVFAIYGPGSTELLHQTNEHLDLQQLDIARKVILDTLLELAC